MTKTMVQAQKWISFANVFLAILFGAAASIVVQNWYLKCGAMALATVLLFFACLRFYLSCERQISKWYRSSLVSWHVVLFDLVTLVGPVVSLVGAVWSLVALIIRFEVI